jgi:hypothetical protein
MILDWKKGRRQQTDGKESSQETFRRQASGEPGFFEAAVMGIAGKDADVQQIKGQRQAQEEERIRQRDAVIARRVGSAKIITAPAVEALIILADKRLLDFRAPWVGLTDRRDPEAKAAWVLMTNQALSTERYPLNTEPSCPGPKFTAPVEGGVIYSTREFYKTDGPFTAGEGINLYPGDAKDYNFTTYRALLLDLDRDDYDPDIAKAFVRQVIEDIGAQYPDKKKELMEAAKMIDQIPGFRSASPASNPLPQPRPPM